MICRLNNGDVTKKAAQAAACLKPKDFSKVYTQVQAALETIATTTTPITQSPSLRVRRKKEPLRELPSKDSPKKRQAGDLQKRSSSDAMDIETPLPETPKKKRKNDFSPDPALLSTPTFSSISSSRTITIVTPVKRPKTSTSVSSSPLKRSMPVMNATLNLPSSSEENEVENLLHPRRFRPVYLDCKQWNARDPRLARIWKKTEMRKQVLIEQCGYPLDRYRPVEV